jgi:hypothetical protein
MNSVTIFSEKNNTSFLRGPKGWPAAANQLDSFIPKGIGQQTGE